MKKIVKAAKKFPVNPEHPERICWGCDQYCPADSLMCGNGAERTQHPAELFGADWLEWGLDSKEEKSSGSPGLSSGANGKATKS